MSNGIYGYWDNIKSYVTYIGRFTGRKRINEHYHPSRYDEQPFNQVLQNNPERYEAFILAEGDFSDKELNEMESQAIEIFQTYHYDYPEKSVFNFTKGGEGVTGYKPTEETKYKISEAHKGKTLSDEHKRKIGESSKGRTHSDESKQKMSESKKGKKNPQWKNYARITKQGFMNGKNLYGIIFNGKKIKRSISIDKLEKWFKENYPNEELIIE